MEDLAALKKKVETSDRKFEYLEINDNVLKRYLIAHKTVDEAYDKMLDTDTWRKDFEVAKITSKTPGVISSIDLKVARILDEKDKLGRPVVYIAVCNHSFRNRDIDAMTQYIVYTLEELCNRCSEDGPDNVCLLYDMRGFSLSCMDYPLLRILFNILTDHYPERLGKCLILNAPFIFSACWAILNTWFDENTSSKIKFIKGTDQLATHINPSIVPEGI